MFTAAGGVMLVCFRQPQDEFFIVDLSGPDNWNKVHFDPVKKATAPDNDAISQALGSISAFVNGVEDSTVIPISSILGDWEFPNLDLVFTATNINRTGPNPSSGLSVTSSQLFAKMRYKSMLDKNIDYRLVIQRSTGRFSETYTEESAKIPFIDSQGRCIRPTQK